MNMGADPNEDSFVLFLEVFEHQILANRRVALEFHSQVNDPIDFCIDHVAWQTVLGNSITKHSAWFVKGLIDGNFVALPSQLVGARESRGSRTHNGYLILVRSAVFEARKLNGMLDCPVTDCPFHGVDGNGPILGVSVTLSLARMRADPAHDGRKRVGFDFSIPGRFHGLFKRKPQFFPLSDDR